MRKHIRTAALVVCLSVSVAACSAPADSAPVPEPTASAEQATTPTPTPSPSPSAEPSLPDVEGMTLKQAAKALASEGASVQTQLELPHGLSQASVDVPQKVADQFTVTQARSNLPVAGKESVTLFAEPTEEIERKYFSWQFDCSDKEYGSDSIEETFYTLESIWESKNLKQFKDCDAEFLGDKWEPTKLESEVEKLAQEHWDGGEEPVLAFASALEYCTVSGEPTVDDPINGWGSSMVRTMIQGAVKLCPDAPFHKSMADWASGKKFNYGTYDVGDEIPAGTYKSSDKISDCYWERMTSHGTRISNDFITHASKGAIVTLRAGETFEAREECGIWSLQK